MSTGVMIHDTMRRSDDIELGGWDNCRICVRVDTSIQKHSDPWYLPSTVSQIPRTPKDVTCQLFDTRNHPTRASREVYIFLLQPMGYQPAKCRPCAGESTRVYSRIDRVRRGVHTQGLEDVITDEVCKAHAGQRGHDV